MRVVVSGGTGLIGSALAARLIARGDEVVITSRAPERVKVPPAAGVAVEAWDTRNVEQIAEVLAGTDAVVHLAGEGIADGRWSDERKRRIRDSRTLSTAALAAAFGRVEVPPRVLVQGSAVGFYGWRGDEELTESSAAGDGFLAEVCQQWEEAGEPVEALGVRRAIARTGVVLATAGGALPKMALPFRLFAGGPVGGGRQWVPWIHMQDEVGALIHLLDRADATGPYNLTAPQMATQRSLATAIGKALGRPSFMPTPGLALKLALGEMSELLLESQKVRPAALEDGGYSFRFPDLESALRDLLA